MNTGRAALRFFLDESVPDSVAGVLREAGHEVILLRESLARGSPDPLVCAAAEIAEAILVAIDADMKKLASRQGLGGSRFRRLSLLKLSCRETRAAARVKGALSLIEHEWTFSGTQRDRRIFIEIGDDVIRTHR